MLRDGPAGTGNTVASVPETTSLSEPVPAQALLGANHVYSWNVQACTGLVCGPFGVTWRSFYTGAAPTGTPGIVQQSAPADGANGTGTTPALSWSQPTGAVAGTTTYTVAVWDPTTNSVLTNIAAGTGLSVPVPSSAGLVLGHSYHWNVFACNPGNVCSPYNDHWFSFSTAAAPSVATMTAPADNSGGWSPTPQLSWSFSGGIANVTTCTVSFWDPLAPPAGHYLPDLQGAVGTCSATAGGIQVPVTQQLFYGQPYQWNVQICNGEACSGYAPHWFTFTIGAQPPVTPSGATLTTIANGDFSGASGTTIPSWTGSFASAAYDQAAGVSLLQSQPFSPQANGGTGVRITLSNVDTTTTWLEVYYGDGSGQAPGDVLVYSSAQAGLIAPSPQEVDAFFNLPSNAPSSGKLTLRHRFGGHNEPTGPTVARVQLLGGPAAQVGPGLGLAGNPRFGKNVGAYAGAGVDVTTGAFSDSHTDLALPGVMGLSFSRAYQNQHDTSITTTTGTVVPGPLGPHWTHNWQYSYTVTNNTSFTLLMPSGESEVFTQAGSSWAPPLGVNATLATQGSTYVLTTADQLVYTFGIAGGYGRLLSVADRNGNTTTLGYDGSGNLLTVSDPGGRSLSLGYTGTGAGAQLTTVSDSSGRSVHYGYDATSGDLTSVTDVLGEVTHYAYTGHWLAQITDPLGNVVLKNTYDNALPGQPSPTGLGQVTQQTDAAGGTLSFGYAALGAGTTVVTDQRGKMTKYYFDWGLRLTDVVDAVGNRASATYDADKNLVGMSNSLGGVLARTYDAWGNLLSSTDAWNETSYFTYDGKNDLLTSTDPLNNVTTHTYDARGNLSSTKDALGNTASVMVNNLGQVTQAIDPRNNSASFGYNASGDRTTITDALNHTTTTAYDSAGRSTSVTDALNHTSSATYNAANEVLTATNPLNQTTTSTYDANGHVRTVQDANLKTTTYTYDARGLLTSVVDPQNGSGAPTTYAYDPAGNRITVTDAKGQATHYTYDDDERLGTVTDPLGNVLDTYTYDALGRVATHTDAKDQTSTVAYTLRSQVSSITYADSTVVSYQYDALGNRTQMVDPTGRTTYQYDTLSRPTSITFPGNKTVGYGYDAAGNRSSVIYPGSGKQVTYSYDQDERLASVTDWNSQQTSYSYDAASRLIQTTLPASTGVTSAYNYDNANRLLSVTHSKGGSTIAAASYTLDAVGNRIQKTTPAGNETYTYDNLYRLTTVIYPDSTNTGYTYDQVGNRLTMTTAAGSTTYSYDAADRLTNMTPPGSGSQTNSYDANGSETARSTDSFTWDAANRLSAATISGQDFTARYNGDNLRISRTVAGTTTNFVWDVASKLPVVLDDGTQYVYGAGLVSQVTGSGTIYFLADGLGSTVAVVDGSGNTVKTYTYDAFGVVKSSTGTQNTEYQFAGQDTDPTGLQYLRARYYDPMTGRFLSRDAYSLGNPAANRPYTYAGANPAVNADPSGTTWIYVTDPNSQCPCYPIGAYDPDTGQTVDFHNDPNTSCNCTADEVAEQQAEEKTLDANNPNPPTGGPLRFIGPRAPIVEAQARQSVGKLLLLGVIDVKTAQDLNDSITCAISGISCNHPLADGKNYQNDGRGNSNFIPGGVTGYWDYYHEYTVAGAGEPRGPMRLVVGAAGEVWFTPDHYVDWFELVHRFDDPVP